MKIAITGANGFLGQALLKNLTARGYEACGFIRRACHPSQIGGALCYKTINYEDQNALCSALEGFDILIHNAGMVKALTFNELYNSNVLLSRRLILAANQCSRLSQFILISSQAASRPVHNSIPVSEADPPHPVSWYGKSKLLAEKTLIAQCRVPWTVIRPASVYGAGDREFLSLFKMLSWGINLQTSSKDNYLSLIHVQELCRLIELTLCNKRAQRQIFFASDGETYTQELLCQTILETMGKRGFALLVPDILLRGVGHINDFIGKLKREAQTINSQKIREITAGSWLCSIEKAKARLAFDPQPNLKKNIQETYQWYIESGWL